MKIVTFGGGTGHHQLAKALKLLSKVTEDIEEVNFIVGTWDDGGSSKYLRIGEKLLPPGDLGNVYSALSNLEENELKVIWDGRVNLLQDSKHTPRNLIIANAIREYKNNWEKINELIKKILLIENKFSIYPVTKEATTLVAVFEFGSKIYFVEGEEKIDFYIEKKKTEPEEVYIKEKLDIYPLEKIKSADLIIVSPGSFYTSVYPHFTFEEVKNLIKDKKKIVIANIFTQGRIYNQLKKLYEKIGEFYLIYNTKNLKEREKESYYKKEWKKFVEKEDIVNFCKDFKIKCYGFDLLHNKDPGKHDEIKLSKVLYKAIEDYWFIK